MSSRCAAPWAGGSSFRNSSNILLWSRAQLSSASGPKGNQGSANFPKEFFSQNQFGSKSFFQESQFSAGSPEKSPFSLGTRFSRSYRDTSSGYFFLKSSRESARYVRVSFFAPSGAGSRTVSSTLPSG